MTDYEKLKNLIDETNILIDERVMESDNRFQAWHMKVSRFLIKAFGAKSHEYEYFDNTSFSLGFYTFDTPDEKFITACANGLRITRDVLSTYLEEVEEEQPKINNKAKVSINFSKVFIVHGHDGELKEAVARLVEQQNIEAIILSTKTNEGKTIIEKIEHYSDVGAAICLFTADDKGKSKLEKTFNNRARQNVVFEAGYFMGKLGRNRLVIISENNVELPSDMSGMVYTSKNDWKVDVLKELKVMGFSIDFNKLYEG